MKKLNWLWAILLCQGAGIIGSLFTFKEIDSWYSFLNKPSFNPPPWVFGPVWTFLYLLMGISLFLIWRAKNKSDKKESLKYFYIQLVLNVLWSIIFFGAHSPTLAGIEIIVLWMTILILIRKTWKVSKTASYLFIPYLLWVSFAGVLNWAVAILN